MTDLLPSSDLVTFYGKMLTFSRIKLATDDFDIIESQLAMVSPKQNSLIPIVIDSDVELDLKKLVDLLWDWGLQPIGVIKGSLDKQAKELKMALFPADGKRIKRVPKQVIEITEVAENKEADSEIISMITDTTVSPTTCENSETELTNKTDDYLETDVVINDITDTNVGTSAPASTGLFGQSDTDKIFGNKVTAHNSKKEDNKKSNYNSSHTTNSIEQKSEAHTVSNHNNNDDKGESKKVGLDGIIIEGENINEASSNQDSHQKNNQSDTEKQAEEKIKRFSSRAEVIAKINEANKDKEDPANDNTSDILEQPWQQKALKADELNHKTNSLVIDSPNETKSNTQTDKAESNIEDKAINKSPNVPDGNDVKKENKQRKIPELKEQKEVRVEYVTVIENEKMTSRVYDQVLRSGQSLNHIGGDLILTNSVNDGAEAITENSLHIYGRGMGRLVAGATGDQGAQIFCQKFNPSLVSVAGTYMLRDNLPPEVIDKSVQVSYKEGEGLVFRVMDS